MLALDIGALLTKAAAGRDVREVRLTSRPTVQPSGGLVSELLAGFRPVLGAGPPQICLAVSDAWLNGDIAAAREQERCRRLIEDELNLRPVIWVSQSQAVAASLAVRQHGPGTMLLTCDAGGTGVRTGLCEITGTGIRLVASHAVPGGGWREFAAGLQDIWPSAGHHRATWHDSVRKQAGRATILLDQAVADAGFRDAAAYTVDGPAGPQELSAGQLIDQFGPTDRALRQAIEAVLASGQPSAAVLTGGLSWFPLAARVVTAATGLIPEILPLTAAAQGALLVGQGEAQLAPLDLPEVSLPMHQVSNGLLEEFRLPVPWSASFGPVAAEPVPIDGPDLSVEVSGQLRTVSFADLRPGRYRVGVRPASPGQAFVYLQPDRQENSQEMPIGSVDLGHT